MTTSYILLSITSSLTLFQVRKILISIGIVFSAISALYEGIISFQTLIFLGLLGAISYFYHNLQLPNKYIKVTLFLVLLGLIALSTPFHVVPGVSNALVFDRITVSAMSKPYSMFLNFDNTIIAQILCVTSSLIHKEESFNRKAALNTFILLMLCILIILIPAYFSGFIRFDPKIPSILPLWLLNNLLFVCLSSEVVYRGFLQSNIQGFLKLYVKHSFWPILISSILFGLSHYKNGLIMISLSTICGLLYGYAYHKTGKVLSAMLVHLGLNLCHLLLFTYPSAVIK